MLINILSIYVNNFCDAGQVPILRYFKACVHLLYCAHFIIFFSFLTGVEHRHFSPSEMLSGCLVCVICNFNSIHSIIFKLCIMIVHTLKMCAFYIVRLFHCFFLIFDGC